ncbi:MAG: hypothetical protein M3Y27_12370, partial [Acidobacteriota bacterium]|nr:hypothetical protein [Acidobacteriota bacterium]
GITNATIFQSDAADFTNLDWYTFIYMYNPFPEPVMTRTIQNICRSLTRRDRRITLVYKNPVHDYLFAETPFRKIMEFNPGDPNGNTIHVYMTPDPN